jgi:hypothetical protein
MTNLRWQDWVNLVLGALLAISPWALGYAENQAAMWGALVVGVAIALISVIDLGKPAAWEEWVNLVLGLWLIISPFALGFSTVAAAAWSAIVAGVLVAIFAAWALYNKEITKWWHERAGGH